MYDSHCNGRAFFILYLGPSRVCKGCSVLYLPGSSSSFFFTSSTCSVSQTQTQPEGCCRPVYWLRLLHPNLQASCGKMRMLWGLGKHSSSSSSFDTSFKEVATRLILRKERDKCSFSRSLFSGWVQNLQNFFFFLKNICMIEILS